MAKIIIPTPLRKFTEQNRDFTTDKETLSEAINQFTEEYPGVKENMLDEDGNVRSYIKIYIGDEEVDPADDDTIEIESDTEISIVPAIAGGISELRNRNVEFNALAFLNRHKTDHYE